MHNISNKNYTKYNEINNNFVSKILNYSNKKNNILLEKFIRSLYYHYQSDDLSAENYQALCKAAEASISFMQERKVGDVKLRIINVNKEEFGSEHTIIEVLNDDMPFIIDSLSKEFERNGLKIYRIINPVLSVVRDEKDQLVDILEVEVKSEESIIESFAQFYITKIIAEDEITKLYDRINYVLKNVRVAVADWKPILKKIEEAKNLVQSAKTSEEDKSESGQFLSWLEDNNFIFLGYATFNEGASIINSSEHELGILKIDQDLKELAKKDIIYQLINDKNEKLVHIGKVNKISLVHRNVNLEYVALKVLNSEGKLEKIKLFVGFFATAVNYQSAKLIPIVRKKLEYVVRNSGFPAGSHNGKELITIIEAFPREELLQISQEELFTASIGIFPLIIRPEVKLFIRTHDNHSFMSAMVFLPKERYSAEVSEKVASILKAGLHSKIANNITYFSSDLVYLYFLLNLNEKGIKNVNLKLLEKEIEATTTLWMDNLLNSLTQKLGESAGDKLFSLYNDAFPNSYREKFMAETHAFYDIEFLEKAISTGEVIFHLYNNKNNSLSLKIYTYNHEITLSQMMPILDNMGFNAIDEHSYEITRAGLENPLWLHHFQLTSRYSSNDDALIIRNNVEEALSAILGGMLENDGFNRLIIASKVNWREVSVIRALNEYIKQIRFTYSQSYIEDTLVKHAKISGLMVELFNTKFNINFIGNREVSLEAIYTEVEKALNEVTVSTEDKVIRKFIDVIKSILRTNYFQKKEGQYKSYISFKFDSHKVPDLPLPRPYAEIFVYSTRVKAIHLRGGKVARGGLRWSDRSEDFRTEVLGLMKAQMAKNSIIVPVGSKGGFVVKQTLHERDAFQKEGIECYKIFLRGLLDITDNIIDGNVVAPIDVVRYDDNDPYLVVAADKGTATFSDIANSISKEYNFWLGDAFASGGSDGYDHKKMGITARGGWVSVERHFREMGRSTFTTPFTVVGIGDMSGDVFGNGMLLSDQIKLVAAFNHLHIFLDPNPDHLKSFEERKRLFCLPRSNWTDYNTSLISQGGGIYERKAKSIVLTPEVKLLLGLEKDIISPDDLVKAILSARVDLLWNGGIGTYVKAESEVNEQVGDKSNDQVRINGKDLCALIVGEGGNLGFTQRGRIEYAMNGGRINTDALDNSAGVDCSDHEVNIKIALGKALNSNKIKEEYRKGLLSAMTEEVGNLVLRDNILQTLSVSISEKQGNSSFETNARLINLLEKEGILDRNIEFLPNETEMARRSQAGITFTRPELAVILAYSKLSIYNNLLPSNLPDDEFFSRDLLHYFPKQMQAEFKDEIYSHALKREIIATSVTNSIVNRLGSTFFHLTKEDTGLKGCDIARAYCSAVSILGLDELWHEIEKLEKSISMDIQLELYIEIKVLAQKTINWVLRNLPQPVNISQTVKNFALGIKELFDNFDTILVGNVKEQYEQRLSKFKEQNLPEVLARKIAAINILSSACDIVQISNISAKPITEVAKIYFGVGDRFSFDWLQNCSSKLIAESYWKRLSIKTIRDDLADQQRKLTSIIIKYMSDNKSIESWYSNNQKQIERYDNFINDLQSQEIIDFSMVIVAAKRLDSLFII